MGLEDRLHGGPPAPGLHLEKDVSKQIAQALGDIAFEMKTDGMRFEQLLVVGHRIANAVERLSMSDTSNDEIKVILERIEVKVGALTPSGQQAAIDRITAELKAANDALAAARQP